MDNRARGLLEHRAPELAAISSKTNGGVVIEMVPFLAQVGLRLSPSDAGSAPFPLPLEPNRVWEEGSRAALWLGPDEWLILGRPGEGRAITEELETALSGKHVSVLDLSANRVALEVSGPRSREALSLECSLDLHPRAWTTGMCAQTLVARTPVVLHQRSDLTGILVRPSLAEFVLDRLVMAADSLGSEDLLAPLK